MKKIVIALFLFGALVSPCFAGPVNFTFDLQPAAVLISSDADGFAVTRSGSWWWEMEEIEGSTSLIPTLRAGIGIDTRPAYIDLKAGVGYLYNGAFTSPLLLADAAVRFKLGRAVTLGPRIGLISITSPSWSGDADLAMDQTTGLMGGVDFTVGRKIAFIMSVDYVDAVMDVTPGSGWTATSDQIDLSGIAVRMGITGRF